MADITSLPQRDSRYFTEAVYEMLTTDVQHWSDHLVAGDAELRESCQSFLNLEARLLDEGRFDEWLDLYAEECVYWVPSRAGGGDPAREVAIALDDRRRLEDRVVWLRSAYIWSQIPRSRTTRLISNVEVARQGDEILVRSNMVMYDGRGARHATHFGWYLHRLVRDGASWRIRVKQVHLAAGDQAHENMSIIF